MDNQRIQVSIGVSVSHIEKYRQFEIAKLKASLKEVIDSGRLNEIDDWQMWIDETENAALADLVQNMFEDSWKEYHRKQMGWL